MPDAAQALPLVSIIIANYNYARFLGEAIQSALDQTYPAVEVLLVDDGSTDDSLAVAARYPVRVLPQPNGGVSAARNAGARASRGEYLLFLDADDLFEPATVERLLYALRGAPPEVAYAYAQVRWFGDEERVFLSRPFSPKAMVSGTFISLCSLIRREAFEAVGGWDPTWRLGLEDYEFWIRMLYHGYHGLLVPEPLLRYRRHGPTRNSLDRRQTHHLKWRMILTYPTLFWRKVLKHPLKSLYYHIALGQARNPHGPPRRKP